MVTSVPEQSLIYRHLPARWRECPPITHAAAHATCVRLLRMGRSGWRDPGATRERWDSDRAACIGFR
jgi:hypothetical protein